MNRLSAHVRAWNRSQAEVADLRRACRYWIVTSIAFALASIMLAGCYLLTLDQLNRERAANQDIRHITRYIVEGD